MIQYEGISCLASFSLDDPSQSKRDRYIIPVASHCSIFSHSSSTGIILTLPSPHPKYPLLTFPSHLSFSLPLSTSPSQPRSPHIQTPHINPSTKQLPPHPPSQTLAGPQTLPNLPHPLPLSLHTTQEEALYIKEAVIGLEGSMWCADLL